MTMQIKDGASTLPNGLDAALIGENAVLLRHLHLVQEELERLHSLHKDKDIPLDAETPPWEERGLLMALAESRRLQVVAEVQQYILKVQASNSLPARLGILLLSTRSVGVIPILPRALWKFWRCLRLTAAPEIVGGETYQKIIAAYEQGSREAVEALLAEAQISPTIQAAAYTALARHLMRCSEDEAAIFARRAYETDPHPYRLKWLAFRLYGAGSVIEAEALLDVLPSDTPMSDSEQKEASRIRSESCAARVGWAQQLTSYMAFKKNVDEHLRDLVLARKRKEELATERMQEIENLSAAKAELEQNKTSLTERQLELETLTGQQTAEIENLSAAKAELERNIATLTEQHLEQLHLNGKNQAELTRAVRVEQDLERQKAASIRRMHELESHVADLARTRDTLLGLMNDRLDALSCSLGGQKNSIEALLQKQSGDFDSMRKFLAGRIQQEALEVTRQVEAASVLQQYFVTGTLSGVSLNCDRWPVISDFALYLVECMERRPPDIIIEFGSGTSTTIVARVIANMHRRNPDKSRPVFVSFDHQEQFYKQTQDHLTLLGLAEFVNLILAPLQDYVAPDGTTYPYYACLSVLEDLGARYAHTHSKVLVIVDGPPTATGPCARYPAFPIVMQHFAGAQLDFLLDDYVRDDEKHVVKLWQEACASAGLFCSTTERKLIKGACLLRIAPDIVNEAG